MGKHKRLVGLGACIRAARARQVPPMKQVELARRMGCDVTSLCRLEAGRVRNPRMAIVLSIAHALRVSVDELIGWKPPTAEKGR